MLVFLYTIFFINRISFNAHFIHKPQKEMKMILYHNPAMVCRASLNIPSKSRLKIYVCKFVIKKIKVQWVQFLYYEALSIQENRISKV